jgi:hypothetical protein
MDAPEWSGWRGRMVRGPSGEPLGRIEDVLSGRVTGAEGRWAVVGGTPEIEGRVVPLDEASRVKGHVRVPYARELILASPRIDPTRPLSESDAAALAAHYGLAAPPNRPGN